MPSLNSSATDELLANLEQTAMLEKDLPTNVYLLSIPLLIRSQSGRSTHELVMKMSEELSHLQNSGFKAWMLGRMLLAEPENQSVKDQLISLLQNRELDVCQTPWGSSLNKAAIAWAFGYAANHDDELYLKFKDQMQMNAGNGHGRSNTLWAWVMALQAAATAGDEETYEKIKQKISEIAENPGIDPATALLQGLKRDEKTADSDYPAWALSIMSLAAVKMHDDTLDNAAVTALHQSYLDAETFKQALHQASAINKADAEIALAKTINDMAEELRVSGRSSKP